MIRFLVIGVVLALFFQGIVSAGEPVKQLSPVQKTTTFNEPVQKTPVPVVYNEPTQKTPVPIVYDEPTQKGIGQAMSDISVPDELLDELRRLERQDRELLRNIGRCFVRRAIKRQIANYIQDNLPSLP